MAEVEQSQQQEGPEEAEQAPEMCCDGEKTAEQHRHESPDGKCCIDE